jgi:peptidoglycan/xylan/chitin deacetylase (PgdA/CDA1 family)
VQSVGLVDGVEYGYAFEAITRGSTTWMLVMTFGNLEGGKVIHNTRSLPGSVDVIRSEDSGRSWHFVRSITQELGGAAINESSFAIHENGFIIAARGYDRHQWLMLADKDFKVQHKVDLAAAHPFIQSVIGRPRVFTRDGGWYLLARNFIEPGVSKGGPMRLSLFKFDPATLGVTRHVLLDNAEAANVTDGYYAMPYWRQKSGGTVLDIVTYKRLASAMPDIIRLEFPWDEVR